MKKKLINKWKKNKKFLRILENYYVCYVLSIGWLIVDVRYLEYIEWSLFNKYILNMFVMFCVLFWFIIIFKKKYLLVYIVIFLKLYLVK